MESAARLAAAELRSRRPLLMRARLMAARVSLVFLYIWALLF